VSRIASVRPTFNVIVRQYEVLFQWNDAMCVPKPTIISLYDTIKYEAKQRYDKT